MSGRGEVMKEQVPVIYIEKLPVRGERISFQQAQDDLWKVQTHKFNGKTVLKNLKTGERKVIRLLVKPKENDFWKRPPDFV